MKQPLVIAVAIAPAHVCASILHSMILESQIHFHQDPLLKDSVTFEGEMSVDRFIPLSGKPGIGVAINEEATRKYPPEGGPFFV